MKWLSPAENRTFFKFLTVGVLNTIIIYSLYLVLIYVGVQYLVALTIDYAFGICSGFLMNRYWTFGQMGRSGERFLKYATSYVGVYLLNLVLLFTFVGGFRMDARIAQIPALALVTLTNYGLQRFWVFRPR